MASEPATGARPPNMVSRRVGDVVFVVHNDKAPTDEEWDAMFPWLRGARCICVFTDSGGPNSAQRKRGADNGLTKMRSAVVTSSSIAKGIVTAFAWLGLDIKAFSPTQAGLAFKFLDISTAEQSSLWAAFDQIRQQMRHSGFDKFKDTGHRGDSAR